MRKFTKYGSTGVILGFVFKSCKAFCKKKENEKKLAASQCDQTYIIYSTVPYSILLTKKSILYPRCDYQISVLMPTAELYIRNLNDTK